MTISIDEAKTDLSIQLEVKRRLGQERQANAIRLGIEALKRVKQTRDPMGWGGPNLLPGETEE